MEIKTVGLVINPDKTQAFELAGKLAQTAGQAGQKVVVESGAPAGIPDVTALSLKELVKASDVILVLGGDGTMLRVARVASMEGKPVLGIQFGRYGFIMETSPQEAITAFKRVLRGDFAVSNRLMLKLTITRDNRTRCQHLALNDVVIARGLQSRLLRLKMDVGKHEVVRYSADGIIIATPTGSTAYSLSAGGPVVHPDVDVMVLTPIAPHTLNSRALVIPASEEVDTHVVGDEQTAIVTVDGQIFEDVTSADVIHVSRTPQPAKLIQIRKSAFYEQLESRLGFGERFDR